MVRGQLLRLPGKTDTDYEFDGRVRLLAEDLALLSANPDHLAGACAQLAALDQPGVVSHPPSRTLIRVFDGNLPPTTTTRPGFWNATTSSAVPRSWPRSPPTRTPRTTRTPPSPTP
ncbi:hypothetical protein [Streptomyces sp. NPDC048606]|uniref:hypothetical protein n=1 Tax=Streptomyces sp. NPDC048606 TaxID=3154726 RepID=UPI00343D285D